MRTVEKAALALNTIEKKQKKNLRFLTGMAQKGPPLVCTLSIHTQQGQETSDPEFGLTQIHLNSSRYLAKTMKGLFGERHIYTWSLGFNQKKIAGQ